LLEYGYDAHVNVEESTEHENPGHRRWWQHKDGFPNIRGWTALGVLLTAIIAVAGLTVSLVTAIRSDWSADAKNETDIGAVNNYYESATGAPGQSDPQSASACGDAKIKVEGGWGPDRPTFTLDHPAPFTTLDSIRNNPDIGDDRGLMAVRDASDGDKGLANAWHFSIKVQPGHVYRVRMYVENSTFDDWSDAAATGTRVSVSLPTCTGNRIAANGFISSDTAYPSQIWGGITFTSASRFNLAYVPASALLETNGFPNGKAIEGTDFLASKGQVIGHSSLDGIVKAGYKYAEYFSFEVKPQFASE
jgi:hypothetical protein